MQNESFEEIRSIARCIILKTQPYTFLGCYFKNPTEDKIERNTNNC